MLNARDQFAQADRRVSDLKERIARQRNALELARQRGQSTAPAESVLRALHESLRAFEKNRRLAFERMEAKRDRAIAGTDAMPLLPARQP
jgi:hypothetical protein